MIPYLGESRQDYIDRNKENHLALAERMYDSGSRLSYWTQLFTWVQADEIYGDHWDFVNNMEKGSV